MPKRGEKQRDHAERRRHQHRHLPADKAGVEPRFHRVDRVERQLRIDRRDLLPHLIDESVRLERRPDDQRRARIGPLRIWNVVRPNRFAVLHRIGHLHFADDADDGHEPGFRGDLEDVLWIVGQIHPPAERVLARPELLRQALVDDDRARRLRRVARVEHSAAGEANLHRLEIAVADVVLRR